MKRIGTAVVLLFFCLLILRYGGQPGVWTLITLVWGGALIEWSRMNDRIEKGLPEVLFLLLFGALMGVSWKGEDFYQTSYLLPVLFFTCMYMIILGLLAIMTFWKRDGVERFVRTATWLTLGTVYLGFSGMAVVHIWKIATVASWRELFRHPLWLWVIPIWVGDSLAYYGGRTFGKRKLAQRVSPGKTWEGALSGLVGAFFSSIILVSVHPSFSSKKLFTIGVITFLAGVLAPLGDLIESACKRYVDVKDSSNLLPGHGGLLDRIDSLVFTAPFFAIFLVFMNNMGFYSG